MANLGIGIVITAAILIVGVYVFFQIDDAIPTNRSAQVNSTLTNIRDITYSGFELGAVTVIVLAAVAVLGGLFLLGRSA